MATLTGIVDPNNVRTAVINHRPQVCADPTSCHYLISAYNPDAKGPLKVTLKLTMSYFDPTPMTLGSRYVGVVNQN
jgi:hypothetical protein